MHHVFLITLFAFAPVTQIALGQPQSPPATAIPPPPPEPSAITSITEQLRKEAEALKALVKTPVAAQFLNAVKVLPQPLARTVYRTKDRSKAISQAEWQKLSNEEQEQYTARVCPPEFYYLTGYGSPLVYSRVLEVMAWSTQPATTSLRNLKVLDFGYGTIGHLRLMAACGARASGVDVEPMLAALYSEKGDTGAVQTGLLTLEGRLVGQTRIFTGRWPAEPSLVTEIGDNYDIITSKNTLKAGYIHPARPVDERFLVKLGVTDEEFLAATFKSLNSGGTFIIYNICPAQAPLDKPYLPHADGKSPFTKDQFTAAGFEILAFDVDDQAAVLDYWFALGYNEGKTREETAKDIFAWYTIVRKP